MKTFFIPFSLLLFLFGSCNKVEDTLPVLSTSDIIEINHTTAISGGNIINDGGAVITARGVCWSTTLNPTVSQSHSTDSSGIGQFTSPITELEADRKYFVRAYATNLIGTAYGNELSFNTQAYIYDTISDIDGNSYKTVVIGTQIWMAENLRTTTFNDGTKIPLVKYEDTWDHIFTPAYCWYGNNEALYKKPYGALYNWYTINTGKVCPIGWHVPSNEEWTVLVNYLGGESVAGGKMKEKGIVHWAEPNNFATNESGFEGLPGGYRTGTFFDDISKNGIWWCSDEYDTRYALIFRLFHAWGYPTGGNSSKNWGYSIRCIKD